jgi:PAS domain S-box-containing protein/putative nucleotidyltransferase with HDIG domain
LGWCTTTGPPSAEEQPHPAPLTDAYFQLVVESIPHIVWVARPNGSTEFFNRLGVEYTGLDRESTSGRGWLGVVHPDDAERARREWENAVAATSAFESEYRVRRSDGHYRWVASRGGPVLDARGRVIRWIGTWTDIDEHKLTAQAHVELTRAAVDAVAATGDAHDPYTAGHQRRVTRIADAVARKIGLDQSTVEGINLAANLHDIGKVAIPGEILSRPRQLRPAEWELVKTHSREGYEIVSGIAFPWPVAEMILQHHERLDGSGYPDGVHGDAIAMGTRVIAVADVVEAMASHRPYRPALGVGAALEEIRRGRGILYDSLVVDACVHLFTDGHLSLSDAA